jgi:hypothetical protein
MIDGNVVIPGREANPNVQLHIGESRDSMLRIAPE